MLKRMQGQRRGCRRGVATAELAILMPLICFLFVIALDFGRIFFYSVTITNCARNGALIGSIDQKHAKSSNWSNVQQAALLDAGSLSPALAISNVVVTNDSDTSPTWVQVTVTYQFQTVVNYSIPALFNVPASLTMTRTVQMAVPPDLPLFN